MNENLQTIGHYVVVVVAMVLSFLLAWRYNDQYVVAVLGTFASAILGTSAVAVMALRGKGGGAS